VTLLHPSARYSLLVRQRIRVALGAAAALAAISLSPGSAQAYVVTVGGVQYDVTTFTGSYDANSSKFATAANGGVMPWWGSKSLATQFATQVGFNLGTQQDPTLGPFFGYGYAGGFVDGYAWRGNGPPPGVVSFSRDGGSPLYKWAQATPVPAPLPVLGSAAALGFCRRLRSRSKRLRHGASRLA